MKKFFALLVLTLSVTALYGELPRRVFEMGFDFESGFANNIIGLNDIFWTPHGKIEIDFDKLPLGGMGLDLQASWKGFVNVTAGSFSIGSFTGVDTLMYGSISDGLRKLLAEGYSGDAEIALSSGASAFVYTSLRSNFAIPPLEGWKFYAAPAYYIPLLYARVQNSKFRLYTTDENTLQISGGAETKVYTPFSLNDTGSITPDAFTNAGGLDISLGAEYRLTPLVGINLDVGGLISNIPLSPSRLPYQMALLYSMEDLDLDILDMAMNGDAPELEADTPEPLYGTADYFAFRPLEFDFYALYRPFESDLITVKPQLGFSLLTVYDAGFNAGISATLSAGVASVELTNQYRHRLWRHSLNFVLNLGVFELDMGVGLQSQGLWESFGLRGFTASFGLRLGVPKGKKRAPPRSPPESPALESEPGLNLEPDPTQQAQDVLERYENAEADEFPGFESAAGLAPEGEGEEAPGSEGPAGEAAPPVDEAAPPAEEAAPAGADQ
jgi:hypothetical protein